MVHHSTASVEVWVEGFDATDHAYEEWRLASVPESSGELDSTNIEQCSAREGSDWKLDPSVQVRQVSGQVEIGVGLRSANRVVRRLGRGNLGIP